MGNMTAIIVVCSVCGVLILVLLFAYRKMSKKSSTSKLDEEINKYKRINEGSYFENANVSTEQKNKKQLKKGKKEQKAAKKAQKLQQKVSNSVNIDDLEDKAEQYDQNQESFTTKRDESNLKNVGEKYNPFEEQEKITSQKKYTRDDFDDFMNEYSYSRAAVNKNLLKQMEKLPPKVKALVLGNIFNRFDD